MSTRVATPEDPAFMQLGERLSIVRARELLLELRLQRGGEVMVRRFDDRPQCAGQAGTLLRRQLGTDFFVRVDHTTGAVYARCRLRGEPEVDRYAIRTGALFMTIDEAAAALGLSRQWMTKRFLGTPDLLRYKFGTRSVVRRDQVFELSEKAFAPMGCWAGDRGAIDPAVLARWKPVPVKFKESVP